MSLRAFHLVFIALSVVLAAFVAAWAIGQYRMNHEMTYAVTAVAALLLSAGLVVYGAKFQRKTRHLVTVLLILAVPRAAFACPVCFGNSDAPMAKAMNDGILLMLVVVGFMLAAFGAFFITLIRRASLAEKAGPAEAGDFGPAKVGPAKAGHYVQGDRDFASDPQEGTA